MLGVTPAESTSPLVLSDVLYVPSLGNSNLFSWCAAQRNGAFFLEGKGDDIFIRNGHKNGEVVLWAKLTGSEYVEGVIVLCPTGRTVKKDPARGY